MKFKIFFITGVNGVGKTTVIAPLKALLGDTFEVHDFDERGVPNNAGRQWRLEETAHWTQLGKKNATKGTPTIICGFAKPSEATDDFIGYLLLDASPTVIEQRLWNRYQTPESIEIIERVSGKSVQKFIGDNVYYSSTMRDEAKKYKIKIIETSKLTPEEVAMEVSNYIQKSITI